jgi:hypothetical protein
MASETRLTDLRNQPPSPITAGNGDGQRAVRPPSGEPAADPTRRRFDRVTIGFWLGGLALGTGGCLLGAWMPYHHPVAVTVSVLWWGIYLGCLGASLGALFGLLTVHTPASPSRGADGAA